MIKTSSDLSVNQVITMISNDFAVGVQAENEDGFQIETIEELNELYESATEYNFYRL